MDRPPGTPPWLPLPRPLEHPPALRERPGPPAGVTVGPPSDGGDAEGPESRTGGSGGHTRRAGWPSEPVAGGPEAGRTPRAGFSRRSGRADRPREPGRAGGPPEPGRADRPESPEPPRTGWRRFARTRRGAVGLAIVAAALLLWPFAGLSWVPWLVGFVALIMIRLLRLDGPLRGWDVHLAGLVVVTGLVIDTTPWAWGWAASIGVLIAGLVRLPAWRLAALGTLLCLFAGAGYVWSNIEAERAAVAAYAPQQERSRQDQGAPRPNGVLPILLNRIAQNSPDAICDNLLAEPARAPFAAAAGQPDCDAAVHALSRRVTDPGRYANAEAPSTPLADGLRVDACALDWAGKPAGPQLGHLTITAIAPQRYLVTQFRPC